jgi:nucleotidyltransferase/DNA polymerase involved in DNA repair
MGGNQGPVGHLDADCFYVSAERVRFDDLVGVPVGVLGNQGACVIAKSYEMKAHGVQTGEPIWDAMKKCPLGVYVKRDFRWYEILSRMMLEIVREYSQCVEYYSIDEFFFDATPPRSLGCQRYAVKIRDAIMERVSVPVTVGIARTRTLAKLISDTGKPFGAVAVLDRKTEEAILARNAVTEVTGIAGRRERRLQPWGIRTCLDLADADRRLIRELLTATGEALWWELRGEQVLPIHPKRPMHRVLSRGGSFVVATDCPDVLWAWVTRNLERLIEELEFHEVCVGRLAVWLDYRDGRYGTGRANPETPTDRFDLLLDALRPCVRAAWIPRTMAGRMHLFADRLVPKLPSQMGLFEAEGRKAEAVAAVKRAINRRHGRFAVRSGATLPLVEVYRDRSNEYDICDIRGKMCF